MLRLILFVVLAVFVARVFWRIFDNIVEGASGPRARTPVPDRGVPMVRDPVCGTFVVPDRAVILVDGGARVHFCSEACRDKYRLTTGASRPDPSTRAGSPGATSSDEVSGGRARRSGRSA
jgi:YHS domain-containing protein